jgi:hypothetical protein
MERIGKVNIHRPPVLRQGWKCVTKDTGIPASAIEETAMPMNRINASLTQTQKSAVTAALAVSATKGRIFPIKTCFKQIKQ